MTPYYLTLHKNGVFVRRFTAGDGEFTIGRHTDSDIVLHEDYISRAHASITSDNDELHIKDLGSRNGIVVNGQLVSVSSLTEGDVISIGPYAIVVSMSDQDGYSNVEEAQISYNAARQIQVDIAETPDHELLPVLYKATMLLRDRFDLNRLLSQFLPLVVRALPTRRGFISLRDEDATRSQVSASISLDEGPEDPPLSQTLVDYVYVTRNAVLTPDAQRDPRFRKSDSVARHGIRAAMCVPLYGSHDILGVIYVDSDRDPSPFTIQHLHLLTALGLMVGMAVEDTRLYEEKIAQERLAALGEAFASINHTLRNVLMGVSCGVDLVDGARELKDWDKMECAVRIVRHSMDRMEAVVTDVLRHTRPAKLELHPERLHLIVAQAVEAVRPRAEDCGVEIVYDETPLDEGELDSEQVYNVILNFVKNAVEACERGKDSVNVSTSQDAKGFYVTVADTGVGIPAEDIPKLSQPFFTTKGANGTGLGLAFSYRVVEEHSGSVRVESSLGVGSAFTVFFPREVKKAMPGIKQEETVRAVLPDFLRAPAAE